MANNEGVVFLGPGKVQVQSIDYRKFQNPSGKPIGHGVILKIVSSNICGSDQHMVRGRTTAPVGMVLGHEIAGEIVEIGKDVEYEPRVSFNLIDFYHNSSRLLGVDSYDLTARQVGEISAELRRGFETGALKPPSIEVIPFEKAVDDTAG